MTSERTRFERELSWLSFNERVLQEAADTSLPPYDRLGFLAIFSSNLDEFFRVRVAHWRSLLRLKKKKARKLSVNPSRLLREIHRRVHAQQERFGRILRESILPDLEREGIRLVRDVGITPDQRAFMRAWFDEHLADLVRPVLLEPESDTFLRNRAVYLVVELWKPASLTAARPRYALVPIPSPPLPRFVPVPSSEAEHCVAFIDDVIRASLPRVFPEYDVGGAYAVKLSRDADLYLEDEFSGDIVAAIRKSLGKRDLGLPSRFLYDLEAPFALVSFLRDQLHLDDDDMILGGRYHNLHDLRDLPDFGRRDLRRPPEPALAHPGLSAGSIFDRVTEKDRLLHSPYQSYEPVVRFLEEAADDPDVEAISLTVYRVAQDSAILEALVRAAERGKEVCVFIEVQARFDEAANIGWAERLREAGAITLFPELGLKVHAKVALVTRNEAGVRRRYAILSTGNFNEKTARVYADLSLFTAHEGITADVARLFESLAGNVAEPRYDHLLVAPHGLRSGCEALVEAEARAADSGLPSGIALKMNSLEDPGMIDRLYDASRAGVPIDIVVRGVCCLVPGLEGVSETISARSIVDRYLEHARVWIFHNGGSERVYIASADWMTRNLDRRVEVAIPVYDPDVRDEIRELIRLQLTDDRSARIIDAEQRNAYAPRREGAPRRAQAATRAWLASRTAEGE